ncbi:MAG: hypothetical protein ACXWDN_05120 [Limisphaerales bacterium]
MMAGSNGLSKNVGKQGKGGKPGKGTAVFYDKNSRFLAGGMVSEKKDLGRLKMPENTEAQGGVIESGGQKLECE